MTRYAIDAGVAVRLLREGLTVAPAHRLVGPTLLRSEALATLYRLVRTGEITAPRGRELLVGLATMRVRLLGDRVSRENRVAHRRRPRLGRDRPRGVPRRRAVSRPTPSSRSTPRWFRGRRRRTDGVAR